MMQKKLSRFSLIILTLILLISLSVTTPIIATASATSEIINGKTVYSLEYDTETILPASYKTENYGIIQDQGYHGDCWAFCTIATLSINLNRMGIINPDSDDGLYYFSESAVVKYASGKHCNSCNSQNVSKKDDLYICDDCGGRAIGFNYGDPFSSSEDGGDIFPTAEYICNNDILVDKATWGYNILFPRVIEPEEYTTYDFDILTTHHINNPTVEELKRMCYSYGAVSIGYNLDNAIDYGIYYDENENAYFTFCGENVNANSGHGVTLIGYDDNFPKENFKVNKDEIISILEDASSEGPTREFNELLETYGLDYSFDPQIMNDKNYVDNCIDQLRNMSDEEFREKYEPKIDGAFLVKNSWGHNDDYVSTDEHPNAVDTGLAWITYDQVETINICNVVSFTSVSVGTLFENKYSHDEFGAREFYYGDDNTRVCAANVYDFTDNCNINAISFTAEIQTETDYSIYYAPFANDRIITESKILLKNGSFDKTGRQYVTLDDGSVGLPKGKCAIIVELSSSGKVSLGFDRTYDTYISIVNPGESFIINADETVIQAEIDDIPINISINVFTTKMSEGETAEFSADYSEYNAVSERMENDPFIDVSLYAESVWTDFAAAYNAFKNVDKDLNAWQQGVIDEAVNTVEEAYSMLINYDGFADYTEYNTLRNLITENMPSEATYTKESYEKFSEAYAAFMNIPKKPYLKEQQYKLDALCNDLKIAVFSLEDCLSESCSAVTYPIGMVIFTLIASSFALILLNKKSAGKNQ